MSWQLLSVACRLGRAVNGEIQSMFPEKRRNRKIILALARVPSALHWKIINVGRGTELASGLSMIITNVMDRKSDPGSLFASLAVHPLPGSCRVAALTTVVTRQLPQLAKLFQSA
ncbi:hypothetical protein, partial [Azorhizobium oxalatiphilum]|uniref:hypothetical protein n=1 Tax=Azorhizobium oxalatiphilum TaxID=980631 RepID=UPI001AEE913E